jgi:hypothetical protein
MIESHKEVSLIFSTRALITMMVFFAYFIMNSQRSNMGITILCINKEVFLNNSETQVEELSQINNTDSFLSIINENKVFFLYYLR